MDIGRGDGKITAELARSLPSGRAVGVDSSPAMINLAKSTFPSEGHSNLSFHLMDARQLSFQEEFDVAFSNAALHWILDQKSVLLGVARSLRHGGRLLFQMAGKGNAAAVLEVFDGLMATEQYRRYFEGFTFPYSFLTPQEYRQLLVQAGLAPVRVELIGKDMKFPDVAGLAGWIRTTWLPFTERVPAKLRDCLVKDIADSYLQRYPLQGDGCVHMEMMRLEIEAKKP